MYETIELERRGAAALIRLDRPQALNAWNAALGAELLDAMRAVAADDAVRAVGITGNGRAFSSGADLRDLTGQDLTADGHLDVRKTLTTVYHPILELLRTMPKPTVAAVNGPAAGIGCSLALSCDLVAAAQSAYLLLAFVKIGLVPDGGALVGARVGAARAAEMAMLGEPVSAARAREWGLVNRVVADDELDDHVGRVLDGLAAGPTRSYAGTKRQLNAALYAGIEDQLALEADIQQQLVASADFREGVAAFVQKRDAMFSGR
jgi:2-(1,2-epoxy-1,2-dihydrophenyl)acetyl-CoA isomerase